VTFTVAGNTTSGQVSRPQQMLALRKRRLPLTGSRCDLRWFSGRARTMTSCVFPVFSVAVMGKCCDECAYGDY
jgi:hypothetical protein